MKKKKVKPWYGLQVEGKCPSVVPRTEIGLSLSGLWSSLTFWLVTLSKPSMYLYLSDCPKPCLENIVTRILGIRYNHHSGSPFTKPWEGVLQCSLGHVRLCDPVDYSPPGSSVPGILQARILEWIVIPFSRGSSQPRDWTQVSHGAGRLFACEPPGMPTF